jgi:hypothetical protein
LSETVSSDKVGRCAISISYPSPHHPPFDGTEPLAYPTPAAYCIFSLLVPFDKLRAHDLAYFE